MSTMQVFYTTAPENGTITLPEGLRGKPLKIVVEREPCESGILSIAGILKDCANENIHDERYEYLAILEVAKEEAGESVKSGMEGLPLNLEGTEVLVSPKGGLMGGSDAKGGVVYKY